MNRFICLAPKHRALEPFRVVLNVIFGSLALLSFLLLLWQWIVAMRFPLHRRDAPPLSAAPGVTLLKPLKGADEFTEKCLASWFTQSYSGSVQILCAVADASDPACEIVRKLINQYPAVDAQLIICGPLAGTNAKVSKLLQLEQLAKHDLLVISDADVLAPPDLLSNILSPFTTHDSQLTTHCASLTSPGLVNCFYSLANPSTTAMQLEVVAINADFWSQVLQAQSLKPLDFALGAVMTTTRRHLKEIGGFRAIVNCLADDYQLGHRIARAGHRIILSTVAVECFSAPMNWSAVWKHQLRWARTIRVSQPLPYFFSILSNATLWPLLWLALAPDSLALSSVIVSVVTRILMAETLQTRLTQKRNGRYAWLGPIKDLLQAAIWAGAFVGNTIEWRGEKMKLLPNGDLAKI